jgi:glycerol-3-phosphate acyltransferase PlsY
MLSTYLTVIAEAYILGSIPFGYLLYRMREGGDVRDTGSGNIGATNVLRSAGMAAGFSTLVLDAAKGYLAVALAALISTSDRRSMSLAAVAAVLGHIFPVFLKFRGGKGVATGLGAFLALAAVPVCWSLLVFGVVAAIWRYVSLASIVAVGAFPLIVIAYGRGSIYLITASVVCASLIIWRHKANIQRLLAGAEHRMQRRQMPHGGPAHR